MPAKIAKTPKKKTKWKRLRLPLIVAAAVMVAIVAAIDWMSPAGFGSSLRQKTDTFYVQNASLYNQDYLHELDERLTEESAFDVLHETPSVYAHRLKRGRGIVFGYRWFFDTYPHGIDDEVFEKITVWLPEIPSDSVSTLDLSDRMSVIAIYTRGGSAWPDSACSGYLTAGSLVIRMRGSAFAVTLEGTLAPAAVGVFTDLCRPKTITNEFEAAELKFDQLDTWLGKPGRHPYDETYRDETHR